MPDTTLRQITMLGLVPRRLTLHPLALVVRDSVHYLLETPLAPDQSHKTLDDGRIEIRATINDSDQLRWWLMGFGSGVEVVRPKNLREYMRKDAKALFDYFKPPIRLALFCPAPLPHVQ